jgi:hypothetical protein
VSELNELQSQNPTLAKCVRVILADGTVQEEVFETPRRMFAAEMFRTEYAGGAVNHFVRFDRIDEGVHVYREEKRQALAPGEWEANHTRSYTKPGTSPGRR